MNDDIQANVIKISAVITAMPRWITALLAAEGLAMPVDWLYWWLPLSALFAAAMAIVEGWAFSYVFSAWRRTTGRAANTLIILAILSAVIFVGVLFPYIASSVRGVTLGEILENDIALYIWAICVAASTIAIVASVGYAQRVKVSPTIRKETSTQQLVYATETLQNVSEVSKDVWGDWRKLTTEQKEAVSKMESVKEIQDKCGKIEKTAQNWYKWSRK